MNDETRFMGSDDPDWSEDEIDEWLDEQSTAGNIFEMALGAIVAISIVMLLAFIATTIILFYAISWALSEAGVLVAGVPL